MHVCEMMPKGSKEALTVLIVTHVAHVKRVKEALTVLIVAHVAHVERVERSLNNFTHNFLNIQRIFNPQKSFGKLRLRPFQAYHLMLCMLKGSKVILTFDPFKMF